jgi:hypothetical protein
MGRKFSVNLFVGIHVRQPRLGLLDSVEKPFTPSNLVGPSSSLLQH